MLKFKKKTRCQKVNSTLGKISRSASSSGRLYPGEFFNTKLGVSQSKTERFGNRNISYPCRNSNPHHLALRLVTILTELAPIPLLTMLLQILNSTLVITFLCQLQSASHNVVSVYVTTYHVITKNQNINFHSEILILENIFPLFVELSYFSRHANHRVRTSSQYQSKCLSYLQFLYVEMY